MFRSIIRINLKFKIFTNSSRRWYSSPLCHYGLCIDVDGVLIKGKSIIPETKPALQFLNGENSLNKKIPFILLTNGGGITEEKKAQQLSKMLDFPIKSCQIVLAHSPMKELVPIYYDAEILIVGGKNDNCRIVAENYGFKKVVLPSDILAWNPRIWPFSEVREEDLKWIRKRDFSNVKIEAVMVFHDSRDWGRDLQITLDVLRSKEGYVDTLASQSDLITRRIPLFAQGSFRLALESLFEKMTGLKLKYELFGKPELVTYNYAQKILVDYAVELTGNHLPNRKIYAVGDNPRSDIVGANRYGWNSILVKTGVFQGEEIESQYSANHVADNILHAVKWRSFSQLLEHLIRIEYLIGVEHFIKTF
ncbi:10024_t:CDS:10 [Diversispora eburnea]|uniref:10024_t:CDS:1 n=1 Tax=Diversispora eburnea TaxID=1213867 RepID=A0A9N8ZMZ8_9GLOM|nr:10024_t:CDS:10 [Diversispora eburnea]